MRREVVYVHHYREAKRRCPWAIHIQPVWGGFMCFSDTGDFLSWRESLKRPATA